MTDALTVVFFPEGAVGPTNNCVGIGTVLARRGHRVVFVVEESFAGDLEAKGFEERLMRLGPPSEEPEVPGQFWKDYIRDTAPEFRRSTLEQLEGFIRPTWQALVDGATYVDERLTEIFDELEPDVIVQDNVVAFPAVAASGRPWVRSASCNPTELRDPLVPPTFSGYPVADRAGWEEFDAEYRRIHEDLWRGFDDFCRTRGAGPLDELEFMNTSPWLNLYLFPGPLDYRRQRPLDPTWHRLDAVGRTTADPFVVPDALQDGDGALVYFSLGSLGSADVELMQRVLDVLASTSHRYIVSLGPRADELVLADNQWGQEYLPQPNVLPQVDLVITHGGNNTNSEVLSLGLPQIVLPIFWDQHANAQRIDELELGARLDTYRFEDADMTSAIERLLGDVGLERRLAEIAEAIGREPGAVKGAELIERLGQTAQPVLT